MATKTQSARAGLIVFMCLCCCGPERLFAENKPEKKNQQAESKQEPAGKETVSFTKDIAPFMVNLCLNCHSGKNPRSGFSLETYELLMKGGKSGRVVLAGNTKDSRL